jgi:uncharacterized protein (DUF488 family)
MGRDAASPGSIMDKPTIFSIGHSSHELEKFIGLLKSHKIEVLVDVRSYPSSQFSPQFHHIPFKTALTAVGIRYLFLGKELGGRPEGMDFYDSDGRVFYGKVAKTALFREGLDRLKMGLQKHHVAMMCSEEDPTNCHRRLLVGRVLTQEGVEVLHIRRDGNLQTEIQVAMLDPKEAKRRQMGLFAGVEEDEWKSIPSVLQKKQQSNSSDY